MDEKSIRLDKWLWYSRIVKSRTLAQKLVRSHKIRINKEKNANPAKIISIGDVLTITLEREIKVLEVVAPGERRGPYSEAVTLYRDLSPVLVCNKKQDASSLEGHEKIPRPSKRNRRKLLDLKKRQNYL